MQEPTYEFVKGQGWVPTDILFGLVATCKDRDGVTVYVCQRKPEIGRPWLYLGGWAHMDHDAMIYEIVAHLSRYSIKSWDIFSEHIARVTDYCKPTNFVLISEL